MQHEIGHVRLIIPKSGLGYCEEGREFCLIRDEDDGITIFKTDSKIGIGMFEQFINDLISKATKGIGK